VTSREVEDADEAEHVVAGWKVNADATCTGAYQPDVQGGGKDEGRSDLARLPSGYYVATAPFIW
jgi:hypothetical protein